MEHRRTATHGELLGSPDFALTDLAVVTFQGLSLCALVIAQTNYIPSVTKHYGRTISSGHYTAQCRSTLNDTWYECNDSSVRPDECVEGPADSAYVLFYSRLALLSEV